MSERVLVTGGSGFIGAHLCRALAREGAEVEVWSRGTVDVRDRSAVASAIAARPPDRVFHLAGVRLMGNSAANLATMFETHVLGTLNVVGAVGPNTRVVVVGSGEEYGRGPVPFREEQVADAQTAYAVSRLATTLACLALASPPICVARLAVVYGPAQVGEMFIPSLMKACSERQSFPMTSGEQTRDFIYVEDAVDGLIALSKSEGAMRKLVNVGTGVECTVRHVAERAAHLWGSAADLRIGAIASRPGEASRYVCAIDRVKALTGWQPRVGLDEGLSRTISWWRKG